MANHCPIIANRTRQTQRRAAPDSRPGRADRHYLCATLRNSLGDASQRVGMRLRDDLLASLASLAGRGSLGENLASILGSFRPTRRYRLESSSRGQRLGTGSFGGAQTGPNPTDRAKKGSKHHVITDGQGIPLAVILTGANTHDVTQLQPLVEAIPAIHGKRGRPRRRPKVVQGDRGYDSQEHRAWLRVHHILPQLARRNTPHGSGLGKTRWVIERTLSWLHQFRRLRVRWERRSDIHCAFLILGCILICWNCLVNRFC